MTYYVNLGGILLYGIKNVEDNSEREITSYDGIGQGFFPVPESRKLRTWTFECEMTEQNRSRLANWTAASKVFTAFEVLLATKDPSRFIFVSNNRNESMSGYLTGYSKKEEYPGVYNVTVKVTEYKAAGVKTTDVPYIKRPGKAPALPKVIVFDSKTTPYSVNRQLVKNFELQFGKIVNAVGSVMGKAKDAINSTLDKFLWNKKSNESKAKTSQIEGPVKPLFVDVNTGKPLNPTRYNANFKVAFSEEASKIAAEAGEQAMRNAQKYLKEKYQEYADNYIKNTKISPRR